MARLLQFILSLTVLCLCAAPLAQAATYTYAYTPLDAPLSGGGFLVTYPNDINNSGLIVGNSSSGPFSYQGGTFTNLASLPSTSTPKGVNDSGDMVGTVYIYPYHYGYLWNGSSYTLKDPVRQISDGISYPTSTHFEGINNNGVIVGYYYDFKTGEKGFYYDKDGYHPLNIAGATLSTAYGINDQGLIVGQYQVSTGYTYGFIYDINHDTYQTLSYSAAGKTYSVVLYDINNTGLMVGETMDFTGAYDGFVYDGKDFTFLYDDKQSLHPHIYPLVPEGINDNGDIVGWYSNVPYGFAASAVPLPSTLLLLGSGLLGLAGWRRLRKG